MPRRTLDCSKNCERKRNTRALRELVQVEDDAFLERLIELGIGPETVLALTLVAADSGWPGPTGTLDGREREATIKAAEENGISPGTAGHQLLETWLSRRPEQELVRQLEAVRPRYLGNLHRRGASANAGKGRSIGPWPWLRHPVASWG